MSHNKSSKNQTQDNVIAVETLRNVVDSARVGMEEGKEKDKEKDDGIPVFWRVFGGTVLSICSLVVMTAYGGFNSSLTDAKSELDSTSTEVGKESTRMSEAQGQMIRKEDCETVFNSVYRNLNDLREDSRDIASLRTTSQELLGRFKEGEKERRLLEEELQQLREEQAANEDRQVLADELARLWERMVLIEARKGGH